MSSVRVVVHGHVQGVFFRDTVRRMASTHGIAGWIRNRDDGAVEAQFEGGDHDVEAIVRFCREGPRGADVEHVEVEPVEPEGTSGFEVR